MVESGVTRRVEVAPERVERWVAGFVERHGGAQVSGVLVEGTLQARGADGAAATFGVFPYSRLGLVLIRRGGYAVALADGAVLREHKVGSRHVQSRTAAGGWSQQRFARRRVNQADALVEAVAGHAGRILLGDAPNDSTALAPAALVVGGDRALVAAVLASPLLARLGGLPRRELYDLPDPTRAVLDTAFARGRAVRVTLTDPPVPRVVG